MELTLIETGEIVSMTLTEIVPESTELRESVVNVTISATPPSNAAEGDLWIEPI